MFLLASLASRLVHVAVDERGHLSTNVHHRDLPRSLALGLACFAICNALWFLTTLLLTLSLVALFAHSGQLATPSSLHLRSPKAKNPDLARLLTLTEGLA